VLFPDLLFLKEIAGLEIALIAIKIIILSHLNTMKNLVFLSKVAFLLATGIFIGSCSGGENSTPKPTECTPTTVIADVKQVRSLMVGQWTWSKTVINQRSGVVTQTPTTENMTKQLRFAEDGNVEIIESGKVVDKLLYEIVYTTSGNTEMEMTFKKSGVVLSTVAIYKVQFCNSVMNLTEVSNSLAPLHTYNK
jgi:hypothetical protein